MTDSQDAVEVDQAVRIESLEKELKQTQEILKSASLFVDAWKAQAEKAEAKLAAVSALLDRYDKISDYGWVKMVREALK